MRIVVVGAPAYLEKSGKPRRPEDLVGHDCIIDTNFRDPFNWYFGTANPGESVTVTVSGRLRFSNGEACVAAAEAGLGICRTPTFVAGPRIRSGALKPILRDFEEMPTSGVHILYPPARHLALKVRVLVDFLAARFRADPPWDQGW